MSDTSTSMGVKSTEIRTSVNKFEVSKRDKPQYFVDMVKDKRRTKNNNIMSSSSGCVVFLTPRTAETLEPQDDRRKSSADQNVHREDIDEAMGEGGGLQN